MTREELMEDLKQGDAVKILTVSDEIYFGYVEDFGASGLKLRMKEGNAQKRIAYERIVEYDMEEATEEYEMKFVQEKTEKESVPRREVPPSEEILSVTSSEEVIETPFKYKEPIVSTPKIPAEETTEPVFFGVISFYNKNGGNGLIRENGGGSIYFYIKQVSDMDLQKILATEGNVRKHVKYRKGLNFKGIVAADAIELTEEEREQTLVRIGQIEAYDASLGDGMIRCAGMIYPFILDEVEDPVLRSLLIHETSTTLGREVEFRLRRLRTKKKNTPVACRLISRKNYSQEEIERASDRLSKEEIDAWVNRKNMSKVSFRSATYEPLSPLNVFFLSNRVAQGVSEVVREISSDAETRICRLLIPEGSKNLFQELPKRIGGPKTFQTAHRHMVGVKDENGETIGVDLVKAEELFITAIQTEDQANSAVANLVNIYIKKGGEDVIKGLQLLEAFGHLLPADKVTNLRIQLIDKFGDLDVTEKMLIATIPRCRKKKTIWQYTARLAGIYTQKREWAKAAQKYKACMDLLDRNTAEFAQFEKHRTGNWKSYILCRYNAGDVDFASSEAEKYLETNPNDEVMQAVAARTYRGSENNSLLEEFENLDLQYEDELIEKEDDISFFLKNKIRNVNLSSTFNRVQAVYSKTQDGVFIGDADDVKKAVDFIKSYILRKNKFALSAEYRSAIYLGIAKIIYDSRNNNSGKEVNRVDIEEVKNFGGRYARYLADSYVERFAVVDSIRFLYIQALKYLGKKDDGNITATINMLVATFFVDSPSLPDELHGMKSQGYNDRYFGKPCISVKDFCIATFMLQDRQKYVNHLLKKAFDHSELKEAMIAFFRKNTGDEKEINDFYAFESLWKDTRRVFTATMEQLGREIRSACSDHAMVESIRQHAQRITDLLDVRMLWNQDEKMLQMTVRILNTIADTHEKYTVEEKVEGYRSIESELDKLRREVEESPTELGYLHIYPAIDELQYAIREQFDELYKSSQPECTIRLSNDSVYVKENTVEIAISFRNAMDRQDADAAEIEVQGSEGAVFARCEKNFTSIKGGEEREYIAVFSLNGKVLEERQFDIAVTLNYQFYDSIDSAKTSRIHEVLPVTITDKENFVLIDNKYDQIFRGSSIDVKTPELFKGRSKLIENICASLSSKDGTMIKNRGIILWGQRRVGKNSVKDYLKQRIRERYGDAYIPVELGSVGSCTNLKEVVVKIVNTTEDVLMMDYPELYERTLADGVTFPGGEMEQGNNYMTSFARTMNRLSASLRKNSGENKNILLYYIDEFSYLYEWIETGDMDGKEFMRFWKSFVQDYGICTIIIAQDNIPVWKSRYENEFACMNDDNEITFLEYDGACELICEPCRVGEKELYTPDAVKLIYELTLGSAYLIVIFCKYIIDYLNKNYTERATKTIVQLVFEKEFLGKRDGMFEAKDFEPQVQDVAYVAEEGERVNEMNLELLKEIAMATVSSSQAKIEDLSFMKERSEEHRKVFRRLKERKIIEVERDTYCSISMPLLKLYLLREQSALTKDVLNKLLR